MSNARTIIIITGALVTLIASFSMTYSVYKYGISGQSPETTQIIEEEAEHGGD